MAESWTLGRVLDAAIEPFMPREALRRRTLRMALDATRQYDGAAHGRRTQGWKRTSGSAAREVQQGLVGLRNGARELVRNDKYAASALRQIVANMVGDGITATATHADPLLAEKAQAVWDDWAESLVDGEEDFYGIQKLTARSMIEGGETLLVWSPDKKGPNGRVRGLEGDFLDHQKSLDSAAGTRIVQGVEFDPDGFRAGYWLLPEHPGDARGYVGAARKFDAAHVDHVFERLRWGQPRGVSWFSPVIMDIRDVGDIEDAVRMRKKVEACLALILTPPENGSPSDAFDQAKAAAGMGDGTGVRVEKEADSVRPGMVFRARPGETANTLNPPSSGDTVGFIRQQMMGVSANLAPYHLVTGDVSQANYSSLRACLLGFWANLDDWQQNVLVPKMLTPAFRRIMTRQALLTGDRRYLQVKPSWAMPPRRFVDPQKDIAAEKEEIRVGLKTETKALAERGLNPAKHRAEIAADNADRDRLGLVNDADPRKSTKSGQLQKPTGFIRPQPDAGKQS
ncbi:phage portal protein [Brevundimonas subvibrioides]|uniref:Phage portal protein, lambda family n=1 Tax=Brevundimonas subvibrioides (strain ATCC 15264 / DSM 4735 / LMG 14903 / NBRC 16000 / CB 81) TaxID=633149 RepID=D9QI93_BRESC|nr:phage portal protein [Brevundimonas subvibrioides]ADK99395.1 phage portal protein, lambda family [Brevundimonas subvibrioides ATCC 15264]